VLAIAPVAGSHPVVADRNQTELAILNLAINARDAMPEGGKFTMTLASVHLHGEPDDLHGEFAALTMTDTGAGMSPELVAKAFEPFFTTKGPGKGTGLGLSMVQAFAREAHGGVAIHSVVGEGTSVTLYLPRQQQDNPSAG